MATSDQTLPAPAPRLSTLIAWVLASIVVAPFCMNAVAETDLGWHLAIGRVIAETGHIPRSNLLTWTTPDFPWYATSWLYDLIAYRSVVGTGLGVGGVQLITFVLLSLALLGMAVAAREVDRRGPWLVPAVAMLLLPRVTQRPHMVSWVIEAWVMAFCVLGLRRGWRWRAAAIPLIAIGSNFHAGAVFAVGVLGCFCASAIRDRAAAVREGLIVLFGALALLANPGGLFIVSYNLDHLRVYDQVRLDEFQSPRLTEVPAFFLVVALTVAAAAVQRRSRLAFLLVALTQAAFGLYAVRLAFEFFLIAPPILAGGLPILRERRGAAGPALAFVLLVGLSIATNVSRAAQVAPWRGWDQRAIPLRAEEFIKDAGLTGPHFNSFSDGGYLEWALPELKAFQDARVQAFPNEFFARELAATRSPQTFQSYLRDLGVEWAITTSGPFGASGDDLLHAPDWALVYWDDLNEIYVRRDVVRLASVVERDEFRFVLPTSSPPALVRLARTLSSQDERRLVIEAARLDRARPGDPVAALVRCAARPLSTESAVGDPCGRARAANAAPEWQELVGEAEAARQASVPARGE